MRGLITPINKKKSLELSVSDIDIDGGAVVVDGQLAIANELAN